MASLPPISSLNESSPEQVESAVRVLFEPAPPLLREVLSRRPFTSYEALIDTAQAAAQTLLPDERREILLGHPAIGQRSNLSAFSKIEQGNEEPPEVYERLAVLNKAYLERFGFPFIIFVNGRKKAVICQILEDLLANNSITEEEELERAVADLFLIARDRLKKAVVSNL